MIVTFRLSICGKESLIALIKACFLGESSIPRILGFGLSEDKDGN